MAPCQKPMESTSSGIGITINERLLQKHTNADTLLFVSVLCVCEKWRWQWRFAGFHLQLISLFALSSMRVPSTTRFFLSLGLLLLLLLPSSCYDLHSPPVFYSFFVSPSSIFFPLHSSSYFVLLLFSKGPNEISLQKYK